MICWKCGHLNEENAQFCEKCGADIWHADPVPNQQHENRNQQNKNVQNRNQQNENDQNRNQQNGNDQNRNQQSGNQQNKNQQNGIPQNVNHAGNKQTRADYRGKQAQFPSGSSSLQSDLTETDKNSPIKIAALLFAVLYLIKTVMFIPSLFLALVEVFSGRHIFTSIIGLAFSFLWMMSFVLLVASLVLLAMRRTKENGEYLYLAVVLTEVLHIAVAVVLLIWNMIRIFAIFRGKIPAQVFLYELFILLFSALVLALLFVLFSKEGQKPLLGRSKEELKQMIKDLPAVLQTELEILSAQLSKGKESREGSYAGQTSLGKSSYGGEASFHPGMAAGGPLKARRSLLLFIVLNFLTCGIYSWYFYYSIARDANIICEGDGEETAGLLKHILLIFITCGIYEYIWQCQFTDRLRRNASRYGVTIQENGTTVLLWFIPGSLCCGIGAFVALHIQIKNINKMARAYNEKMFAQNRTNS